MKMIQARKLVLAVLLLVGTFGANVSWGMKCTVWTQGTPYVGWGGTCSEACHQAYYRCMSTEGSSAACSQTQWCPS